MRSPLQTRETGRRWHFAFFRYTAALLCVWAGAARAEGPEARGAFERLQALVGTWAAPLSGGKELRASYRLISSCSALVETYTTPSGKETLTLYHLDGSRLLATHYCGQGNQPRLRLTEENGSRWVFSFLDATNLSSPKAAHLRRLELALDASGQLIRTETYRADGTEQPERFVFTRAA